MCCQRLYPTPELGDLLCRLGQIQTKFALHGEPMLQEEWLWRPGTVREPRSQQLGCLRRLWMRHNRVGRGTVTPPAALSWYQRGFPASWVRQNAQACPAVNSVLHYQRQRYLGIEQRPG